METRDGLLYMIKASTLQARYSRAQKLHLYLLHQVTAYLCQGRNIITRRCGDLPETSRHISRIGAWDLSKIPQASNAQPKESQHRTYGQLRTVKMIEDKYEQALKTTIPSSRRRGRQDNHT